MLEGLPGFGFSAEHTKEGGGGSRRCIERRPTRGYPPCAHGDRENNQTRACVWIAWVGSEPFVPVKLIRAPQT